ncbi:MAG: hypothetical protein A3F72_08435 [Bacteroidetes bacterium RIFCSPLOWO2_12_FULL_35_15]|nr:MAG: hypothetical protein A3F72_08435 [Bacteroidetes bacterium RIFCSPLOWO2_12_FULL_35_15]
MEQNFPSYTELAVSEILQFEFYAVFLRSDNIIQIQTKDNFDCELQDAKNILDCIQKVSKGNKFPLLAIYANFNTFSKEVNTYIATHTLTKADALVGFSFAFILVGNFYLKINKPIRPTKLFNDVESALIWLKNIPNIN